MNLRSVGRSIGLLLLGATLSSANPSDPDAVKQAALLVGQAIQAEIEGDLLGRDRMLKEATQLDGNFAPARWLQGHVQGNDGNWATIEESIVAAKSNRLLADYEAMRATLPASVQGNWQAAQWCAKNGMAMQCRAHLENILMLDHDNQVARKLLGHQLVGNDWLTPADQARMIQRAEFVRLSKEKYAAKIDGLLRNALNGKSNQQQAALNELTAIEDPQAIPVLEHMAELGVPAATISVKLLTRLDHPESSKSLMRIAVLYPDENIRNSAIEGLKKKPLHDYVPDMLAAMSSPIFSLTSPLFGTDGKLAGFRQSFAKEGMEDYRTYDFDTRLITLMVGQPVTTQDHQRTISSSYELLAFDSTKPFGQRRTWKETKTVAASMKTDPEQIQAMYLQAKLLEQVAKAATVFSVMERQARVEAENRQIELTNRRLADVLTDVVNVEFPQVPRDVWSWWDKYNETSYQQTKFQRHRYDQNNIAMPMPRTYEVPGPEYTKTEYRVYKASCFVAGTKINTLRGLMDIEKIMPGDLVLTRDIQSGALGYKPVVCGTNRDPAKTVILKVDDDTIHATTSHLLWVSGKGWVKAGDIKVGDLLHTAAEPAVVVSSTPGPVLPTHNLIVADTHNYFVGGSRVLSHDVLPRGSILEQVPGQTLFNVTAK